MMCIVKLRYNIQYGVNTMSTIISTHVIITFSQYFKILYTNIRIRKWAPDTESLSERSDIRTPNDIPIFYAHVHIDKDVTTENGPRVRSSHGLFIWARAWRLTFLQTVPYTLVQNRIHNGIGLMVSQ
jgi:hypothetical protein